MGKKGKGKGSELGRALLKDRFGPTRSKHRNKDSSMLHTADINDGYQWDRLNLTSVTEQDTLTEFLTTASLAGTEFHAEKLNIKYVNPKSHSGILTDNERAAVLEKHRSKRDLLKIPRRPKWDANMSAQELQKKENETFLEWRRDLATLQEVENLTMTPYERNLEFWRQLWRVVERSDIIVQIVDARNPLLFRCEDLEAYVKEIDENKTNLILLNKADFLTAEQRQAWADYFTEIGVQIAFFSALEAEETESKPTESPKPRKRSTKVIDLVIPEVPNEEDEDDDGDDDDDDDDDDDNGDGDDEDEEKNEESEDETSSYASNSSSESEYESAEEFPDNEVPSKLIEESGHFEKNSPEIMTRTRLIDFFKSMGENHTKYTDGVTTIGLVGYPNVGKSSTINAILTEKKVSVSATPGKTKHFQTLFVDSELLLCDCPGLVMPSFICTKAEMVLNGILPIDQLRDHVPPVTLLGTLIPRHILEDTYGIMIPKPIDGEDPHRPPTSEELLNTWGYNRGFMTQNGQPDNPRSARYVLKDYVNGKLLYCVAPPNKQQSDYHTFPPRRNFINENRVLPARQIRASRGVTVSNEDLDRAFFKGKTSGVHIQGRAKINPGELGDKPWKKMNKHGNKKKREKTRRLFSHLDQH